MPSHTLPKLLTLLLTLTLLLHHSTPTTAAPSTTSTSAIYSPSDKQWKPLKPLENQQENGVSVSPFPPSDNSYESPTTEIYISIANFMDGARCAKTIDNYITKAKYPKRLNFGIIEQINTEVSPFQNGCISAYCMMHGISPKDCHFENIKSVTYSFRLARGLSYAR
jgi:hypothetical protein